MLRQWNVPSIWLLGGLLVILLAGAIFLASRSPVGSFSGEPVAAVQDSEGVESVAVEPQENPAPSKNEAATGAEAPPVASAAEEQVVEQAAAPETDAPSRPGPTVLTGDTRPAQLRALTGSWNTNWERRTIEYDEVLSGGPPRDGIPSMMRRSLSI